MTTTTRNGLDDLYFFTVFADYEMADVDDATLAGVGSLVLILVVVIAVIVIVVPIVMVVIAVILSGSMRAGCGRVAHVNSSDLLAAPPGD